MKKKRYLIDGQKATLTGDHVRTDWRRTRWPEFHLVPKKSGPINCRGRESVIETWRWLWFSWSKVTAWGKSAEYVEQKN